MSAPGRALAHLDHVVIAVSDWERSNAFYRDLLGAELIELTRGRWAYRLANTQLNVHGPGSTPEPVAAAQAPPGAADLCFEWGGAIEGAVEHLASHDVEVKLGPIERHGRGGPGVSVYFRDPDRSLLEFISYS
ncbi:MAG TPA: VOC family protein [Solirubrobacterales bacterium]|nr:VOC family protein [Solirubrobacterales bacterium]